MTIGNKWSVVLLLLVACGTARANVICHEGICREVLTEPLPTLTQDTERMPKKAIKPKVADAKFWLVTGISEGLSIARTITVSKCRNDHGIGPCAQGGYGEFKTREGLEQGLTIGLALLSWKIKKIEDEGNAKYKFWWTLQAANAAVNTAVIIENATRHFYPKED